MYTQHSAARIFQLPVEIRNKIWEECIGNVRFHMHWPPSEKDRLVADICREPECLICISNNLRNIHRYNEAETYPEDTKPVDMKSKSWIMPLLLTSRAIYFEAISTLYRQNVFSFQLTHASSSLLNIPYHIPLSSLSMISYLELRFVLCLSDQHVANWTQVWNLLSQLKALKYLRVHVLITHSYVPCAEDTLLQPVTNMLWAMEEGCLRDFEFVLDCGGNYLDRGDVSGVLEQAGCRIIRVGIRRDSLTDDEED